MLEHYIFNLMDQQNKRIVSEAAGAIPGTRIRNWELLRFGFRNSPFSIFHFPVPVQFPLIAPPEGGDGGAGAELRVKSSCLSVSYLRSSPYGVFQGGLRCPWPMAD